MRDAYEVWHQGIRLRQPNVEFVEVPYRGRLPARALHEGAAPGPAPTVVVLNGMDNAKEMSIFFCGLEFARRGYQHPLHGRPRHGRARLRDMASRYDYEVPGTAAFDYLAKRPDVDSKRIAVMGYSFGGYSRRASPRSRSATPPASRCPR